MRERVFNILCVVILAITCVSCTKMSNGTEQVKDVPEMKLEYTVDGEPYQMSILSGTSSWSIDNRDGTITREETDSPNPLDAAGHLPEIVKIVDLEALKINFSLTPDSYTVRRWKDSYIGNAQAYEDYYEVVEILDNTITLANDGQGYVYEVHATWSQGNAYYAFHITFT